ncbi:S1C family serine protease [Anaerocolumna sp. MB42-C2]|uniref:S1C family serine protease n=1 Tax=Anaerocolumna sp. MB42-C2 TaxID=3070997 RepID=UPI0027DFD471|nr:trypsin-like peptidase domain-containing protein [Anaerocolumna sp. MB42-C2]WMJ86138.1 trypsin-like peptidase domain-containing protein [Anaerocolumna sp. MB42-C2]
MSDDFLNNTNNSNNQNNQNDQSNSNTQYDQTNQSGTGFHHFENNNSSSITGSDNEDYTVKYTSNAAQNSPIGVGQNITSDLTQNNSGEGSQNTSAPYSFWAEQIAASNPNESGSAYQSEQFSSSYNNNPSHVFEMSEENGNIRKKPNVFKRAVKFVLGAAVFGVVAGACFLGFNLAYYEINPDAAPISIRAYGDKGAFGGFQLSLSDSVNKKIAATTVSQEGIQQKTDVTDVVDATMPSIVTITTTYTQSYDWFGQQFDQQNEGGGSGIIVGKNDKELLIATNNHVVEGADPIKVKFIDGTEATAIIKGTDAVADLAVISIDLSTIKDATLSTIKVAKLGDSKSVKVGEMAIAIGNALGYGQSTTVGYISAKDRKVKLEDKTMVLLQTDAAINPGNSGGALLNLNGEVIGINTVKYASSEVEGMGFAIPISRALPIINELKNREILKDTEKGYLGVYIEDVTEDIASTYNWPVGVYVKSTVEGGSAEKAGIIAGDIITKVNDTEITAGTQLREKVTSYRVGTDIKVTVMRSANGKFTEKQITVNLGKNPETKKN